MVDTVFLVISILVIVATPIGGFTFSKYYHDHMVLQKNSAGTNIWGHSSVVGDTVNIKVNNHQVVQTTVHSNSIWQVKLPDPGGNGPYNITASSSVGDISINDVLFGDVWVCSGQSNMEFAFRGLPNATVELADAVNYPNIRLFRVGHNTSNGAFDELSSIFQTWSRPVKNALNAFSAVCWLYGKYLSQHLNYPIGLVETNWGGTPIESWSSQDALSKCSTVGTKSKRSDKWADALHPSVLYNAMISPLIRNTIKGVIWYQGESNAEHAVKYACQFPAMISDWRKKFNKASLGTTSVNFPFGFVQLAPWNQSTNSLSFPELRWAQTANVGYVPNTKLPGVFMAVALDLPDFSSPYGSIHPRFKHDIALRLVLSSLNVAYHQKGVDFQGPFPSSFRYNPNHKEVSIEYGHGLTPIEIRSNDGFELCCNSRNHTSACSSKGQSWTNVKIKNHSLSSVVLDGATCSHGDHDVIHVRYAWKESPCAFRQCAVYGKDNDLPAPPFIQMFTNKQS